MKNPIKFITVVGLIVLGGAALRPLQGADFSWTQKADNGHKRTYFASAVLNGKIYIFGGQDQNGVRLDDVEEYDPATNKWTKKQSMTSPRISHMAVAYLNSIFVIGGFDGTSYLTKVEVYDPDSDTWSSRADLPEPKALGSAFAVTYGGTPTKVYVTGGTGPSLSSTTWKYDPNSNSWLSMAPMPTMRTGLASAVVNNKVYVLGGTNGFLRDEIEVYDADLDTWVLEGNMPFGRKDFCAVSYGKEILLVGGFAGAVNSVQTEKRTAIIGAYNIDTKTWTEKISDPRLDMYAHRVEIVNGRLYVIGGGRPGLSLATTYEGTKNLTVLSGTVYDLSGTNVLPDALFRFYQGTDLIATATSDSAGRYSLNISAGEYDIEISKSGYQSLTMHSYSIPADPPTILNPRLSPVFNQQDTAVSIADNAFNPKAGGTCRVSVNSSDAGKVEIKIYDVRGRLIRDLSRDNSSGGPVAVQWDGKGADGSFMPPGVYFVHCAFSGSKETRKVFIRK